MFVSILIIMNNVLLLLLLVVVVVVVVVVCLHSAKGGVVETRCSRLRHSFESPEFEFAVPDA